jgi:hypothetical protein
MAELSMDHRLVNWARLVAWWGGPTGDGSNDDKTSCLRELAVIPPTRMMYPFDKPRICSVVGVYANLELAEDALRILDAASFPIGQMTIALRNREGPGWRLTGSLAVALLCDVEGVLYPSTAGCLRQLMAWGIPLQAIHDYEKRVQGGYVLLIAHGNEVVTARALRLLAGKDEIELRFHPKSRAEWETAVLRG